MRALYLVPDLLNVSSGIARYSRQVCRALVNSGWTLDVLSLQDHHVSDATRALDVQIDYSPCDGSRIKFVWRACATAFRHRPKIILVGHANFAVLGWCLARLICAQHVVFIYGLDVFKPLAFARRLALRRADQIISISQFTARQAVTTNAIDATNIRILHNCLSPHFEDFVSPARAKPGLSMLTVGRLSRYEQYKGHDFVIRAMPTLLAQFPDLVYHIVGDGDWRPSLEQLATQSCVSHAVKFHGIVSEESLKQHYADADIFVMPSRGEGFGFVFLEAMAHGKPVIGGNIDATPEVIVDGVTGYLVDPICVESIVSAIARLLGNRDLRQQMGQAAARHVKEKFGFPKFQAQLQTYLDELAR